MTELDLERLAGLEELLGRGVPEIAFTLVSELTKAMAGIEDGLAAGDLPAAALAAHAARNSALMLDAQPMLDALGGLERAARARDHAGAQRALTQVRTAWSGLWSALDAQAQHRGQD